MTGEVYPSTPCGVKISELNSTGEREVSPHNDMPTVHSEKNRKC